MATNSKEYNRKNYEKYWGNPKAKSDNASRKRARRLLEKKWKVKPFDWKEVDHKNSNPQDNCPSNLTVIVRLKNRIKWAAKANRNKSKKS